MNQRKNKIEYNKDESISGKDNKKIENNKKEKDNIIIINHRKKKIENNNEKDNGIIINQRRNKVDNNKLEKLDEKDNKPDDIIEFSKINFIKEDIPMENQVIKNNKKIYDYIQKRIKRILYNRRLPQFIFDNYKIKKSIGEGTYGQLYFVINKNNNKKYAIKEQIAHDYNSFDDYLKTFSINIKNKHENILDIYGIYIKIFEENLFYVYALMDLAECDWEQEIEKRKNSQRYYTESELISIIKQLISPLTFLQRRNIAHRDIKLENILLFPKDKKIYKNNEKIYKICDFGEAKQKIKYDTKHNTVRGTDHYMSPELLNGLNNNKDYVKNNPHKSDVYSLGCCFIIASTLNYEIIEDIRKEDKQEDIDELIRDTLKNYYSEKIINLFTKMLIFNEMKRLDFIDLEKIINKEFI